MHIIKLCTNKDKEKSSSNLNTGIEFLLHVVVLFCLVQIKISIVVVQSTAHFYYVNSYAVAFHAIFVILAWLTHFPSFSFYWTISSFQLPKRKVKICFSSQNSSTVFPPVGDVAHYVIILIIPLICDTQIKNKVEIFTKLQIS